VNESGKSDCCESFRKTFLEKGWDSFAIWVAFNMKSRPKEIKETIGLAAKELYGNGTQYCANRNCGIWEPKKTKFKVCGKCKCIRYCSQECQKEDWSNHKLLCKLNSGSATEEEVEQATREGKLISWETKDADRSMKPKIEFCECYNEEDRMFYNAFYAEKCANGQCDKLASSSSGIPLAAHMTTCTLVKRMHIIPYWVCSSACARKINEKYERILK
jgi:hypothetical protein